MPQIWKTYKLKELADVIDSLHKTPEYSKNGFPMIRAQEILGGTLEINDAIKVNDAIYDEFSKKHKSKPGDLVFSRVGAYSGKTSFVKTSKPFCLGQNTVFIIPKKIDNRFLFYYLSSPIIDSQIKSNAIISSYKTISLNTIRNFNLNIPPLPIQRRIASILGALDDKIELNLAMNKTLEEMAMALYKHWFVDFGPFKHTPNPSQEGNGSEYISAEQNLDKKSFTTPIIPPRGGQGVVMNDNTPVFGCGNFIESEFGMIPEGWEVRDLKSICEKISKGTTPRKQEVDGLKKEVPFLKVRDLSDDGAININALELIPRSVHIHQLKRSILKENDIIFSIAGTIGRTAIVPKELNDSNSNQALAFIRLLNKNMYRNYIFSWLKSDIVQGEISSSIVQGVQANVSLGVLGDLKVIIPYDNLLISWNSIIDPYIDLIISNREENICLIETRDKLLPKLISGEVEVKEVVEEVSQ